MHNSYNDLHLLCITIVMLQIYYICNCKELTLEPAIRAIPTESFRFIPPDSVLLWAFLLLTRLMDNSMSSTSCFTLSEGQPFNWTKKWKSWKYLFWNSSFCCGYMIMYFLCYFLEQNILQFLEICFNRCCLKLQS